MLRQPSLNKKLPLLILLGLIPSTAAMYLISFVAPVALGIALTAAATAAICGISMAYKSRVQDNAAVTRSNISTFLDRQVQRGKRLAIVDPETTLLKRWYFELRLSEELVRRQRYGSSITVLAVERLDVPRSGDPASHSEQPELDFVQMLTHGLRALDFATKVSDGRYCMCLPHTEKSGAQAIAVRLAKEVGRARIAVGVSEYDASEKEARSVIERAFAHTALVSEWEEPAQPQLRRLEYGELVARVSEEETGAVSVAAEETPRAVKARLRRAAKRAGLALRLSDGDGVVYFQRMDAEPETNAA